ncbi:hypothetical protein ALC62_01972, partial [Cyphomyrmex costatus]
ATYAFSVWAANTSLTLERQTLNPDILISYRGGIHTYVDSRREEEICSGSFDGPGGVLAHAFSHTNNRVQTTEVHIDVGHNRGQTYVIFNALLNEYNMIVSGYHTIQSIFPGIPPSPTLAFRYIDGSLYLLRKHQYYKFNGTTVVRILERRYPLTVTGYKYLTVGIDVKLPSVVTIVLGDCHGKEMSLSPTVWSELVEQKCVILPLLQNNDNKEKRTPPPLYIGDMALHFGRINSIPMLRLDLSSTVTNCESFDIERPSFNTLSPAPPETFETEDYVHNVHNIQEQFQVDNMWDTNIRQPEQTEFCSPHQFRSLFHSNSALLRSNSASPRPNSASPRPNSASPRPNSTLPSLVRAPSRTPSISPRPSSASDLRDSATPPQRATSHTIDNQSQRNQIKPAKRTKRQLSDTSIDAVDQTILNLIEKRSSIDTINSDDLFYLSISRDSQHLNVNAKLRLKTLVLQALSQVVAEEQNKT